MCCCVYHRWDSLLGKLYTLPSVPVYSVFDDTRPQFTNTQTLPDGTAGKAFWCVIFYVLEVFLLVLGDSKG